MMAKRVERHRKLQGAEMGVDKSNGNGAGDASGGLHLAEVRSLGKLPLPQGMLQFLSLWVRACICVIAFNVRTVHARGSGLFIHGAHLRSECLYRLARNASGATATPGS